MFDLADITIDTPDDYNSEHPTRNQEKLAKFLLNCAIKQKASDQHKIYTEEDFYNAAYKFDSGTLTTLENETSTMLTQMEDSRGVIDNLSNIVTGLIPPQYRILYLLARPVLCLIAEQLYRKAFDEGTESDLMSKLDSLIASLDTLNGRFEWTASETMTKTITQIFGENLFFQDSQGQWRASFLRAFLLPWDENTDKHAILADLLFNDVMLDFGAFRLFLHSRAVVT